MILSTYSDIKTKVGNDLDITDEVFVSDTEFMGYLNEAIADAESAIHNLNHEDKYFLTSSTFSWVLGTSDYSFPADIYANKVRQVFYSNGSLKYEIVRVKRLADTNYFIAGDPYCYLPIAPTAGSVFMARFFPTPNETSTNAIVWYVRKMMRVTDANKATTFRCEVPECDNFVYSHCKYSVAKKTRRQDLIAIAKADRDEQYMNMIQNLNPMVLDEDTLIPQDLGFYRDHL